MGTPGGQFDSSRLRSERILGRVVQGRREGSMGMLLDSITVKQWLVFLCEEDEVLRVASLIVRDCGRRGF
jgi:hypothetical protein